MNNALFDPREFASILMSTAVVLALVMILGVILERGAVAVLRLRQRRMEGRYQPVVQRALGGEEAACRELVATPARHRLNIAWLLIAPLIDDRDPARIERTRAIVHAMSLIPRADRYLHSWLWWRRALALRALGLVREKGHTAAIVAALDDANLDVRAAALDALTDLRDPASLRALVVRMHDTSLHRGRRAAALTVFGTECEGFLLDLSHFDPAHRANYAHALAMCGTERSRPTLCLWTLDPRAEVRAAAFAALAHVGLDDGAARLALDALESPDERLREMAAGALHGWTGGGDAAAHLAEHLDDVWPVAVRAARSLESMGASGLGQLQAYASHADLPGVLARQMLWQRGVRC